MEFPNHVGLWPDDGLYTPANKKPHQTGEPRGLSPSVGSFAANLLSRKQPRALWARCGVKGHCPLREPEGLSPDGGLYRPTGRKHYQTGELRGPLPSGGKTPAKPHVSLRPCALWARCGVQGHCPCLSRRACRRRGLR